MTVGELIELLAGLPADMPVVKYGTDSGGCWMEDQKSFPFVVVTAKVSGTGTYYDPQAVREDDLPVVKALLIRG